MSGMRERLRSERALHQIFSTLGWASIGVLGILFVLFAQGVLETDPNRAGLVYLGLGLGILLSVGQILLCHVRIPTAGSSQAKKPTLERLSTQPLDYLVSLLNVSRAVSNDVSILDLGQVIVDSCRDCFDCDEVSLMMLEPGGTELTVAAFAGHRDTSKVRNARARLGEGVAGMVAQTRTPVVLGPEVDQARFPGFRAKTRQINSAMVAPIVVRNRVVGVLNASTGNPEIFYAADELRVLCILAEHAGIVAAKARDTDRVMRLIRRMRKRYHERMGETGRIPDQDMGRAA